ncbi:hypothetical protein [Arenimonas sp.]|uniref:hypothetical protein n=1 Tax=Arenimonas sp. TaxID=1872635 RepID=UPI0039E5AEE5
MTWWMWLLLAILMAGASGMSAMLSLSAGTAFGTDYHTMTPRQRVMGRLLYRLALLGALLFGLTGAIALVLGIRPLFA